MSPAAAGPVRVGTSGYSFEDWRGRFYPRLIAKGSMLDFYAREFDTVEINSTYYRIMHPRASAAMVGKTPDGFAFFVKLHAGMTHGRNAGDAEWSSFREMLEPFREGGRLAGLLAQFPWSFKPSPGAMAYLREMACRGRELETPIAVEFRNAQWYEGGAMAEAAGMGLAPVSVDLPNLPGLPPREAVTGGPFGYVRLHGRNAARWWEGGPLRYDYGYSREELSGWLAGVRKLLESSGRAFMFFNNCHGGQAVNSARIMKSLLEEGT